MIVAFAPTEAEVDTSSDGGRQLATLRCVRCAMQLSQQYGELLHGWSLGQNVCNVFTFSYHQDAVHETS